MSVPVIANSKTWNRFSKIRHSKSLMILMSLRWKKIISSGRWDLSKTGLPQSAKTRDGLCRWFPSQASGLFASLYQKNKAYWTESVRAFQSQWSGARFWSLQGLRIRSIRGCSNSNVALLFSSVHGIEPQDSCKRWSGKERWHVLMPVLLLWLSTTKIWVGLIFATAWSAFS